jgi:hypothetical protein
MAGRNKKWKIKLWQVCADQKKIIDILEKNGNMNFS